MSPPGKQTARPSEGPGGEQSKLQSAGTSQCTGTIREGEPPKALGYYLRQPRNQRHRAEVGLVTRLSQIDHNATFRLFTPGAGLRCHELAADLRRLADELEAIGTGLVVLDDRIAA